MRCVGYGNLISIVRDSRPAEGLNTIRRRRKCEECGERWTTFELRLHNEIHLRAGMVFTLIPSGELVQIASVAGLEDTLARLESATRSIREGLLGLGSAPPEPRAPWPPVTEEEREVEAFLA